MRHKYSTVLFFRQNNFGKNECFFSLSFYFFGFKPKLFIKRLDEENEKAKKQLIEEFNLTKENELGYKGQIAKEGK